MNSAQLRKEIDGSEYFSKEVLNWITKQNLWNLWVPKSHGGLEKSFSDGLKKLQSLARIDGSLSWTVTLCSGANYFVGILQPDLAAEIFKSSKRPIFGGSGGPFGTAEIKDGKYELEGTWKYATGAPYLTHFTLNAIITQNGIPVKDNQGADKILSFVLAKDQVKIIEDWNTMGLLATATCSFEVKKVLLSERYSFFYDKFFLDQDIFKIPFPVFADLTLWVNYIGIIEHYLDEAGKHLSKNQLDKLVSLVEKSNQEKEYYADQVELALKNNQTIEKKLKKDLHDTAAELIGDCSQAITAIHPFLGMKAARKNHPLNRIFCDYFTATQHHNFVDR
ncbi:MAG TPA: hypothetical protein VK021_06975 [Flavobacteriaceae bacterium]|nr:hypothetical protein [Flavobacteriaceae bacterium]